MDFRSYIRETVTPAQRGIEIGASYSPILPKSAGYAVLVVDHADQQGLRAKYKDDPNVDIRAIEAVDAIDDGGEFAELDESGQGFDYIVGSHILEHVTDPIHFLQRCERALKPDGRLFLLVPDRRFCFDFFRPASTCGQMLRAYLAGQRRHDPGALFDSAAYASTRNGTYAWTEKEGGAFAFMQGPPAGYAAATRDAEEYQDAHGWVFTPSSFRLIHGDLHSLGLIGLGEAFFHDTLGIEFMAVLSRAAPAPAPSRLDLALAALREAGAGAGRTAMGEGDAVRAQLNRSERALREREEELRGLRNSRSWKVTAPARAIMSRLRGREVPHPDAGQAAAPVPPSSQSVFSIAELYTRFAPSAQNAVDIFDGAWVGAFPPALNLRAGESALYDDVRIHWLLEQTGGVRDQDVLELGPLEASHSAMLLEAGARSVLAVEANKLAYLRCLVTKEIRGLRNASFLHGDFMPFLEEDTRRWPLIVASGVLYHQEDPLRLLELLAGKTDTLFLWTHVIDEAAMPPDDPRWAALRDKETRRWRDIDVDLYPHPHGLEKPVFFCGGIAAEPRWMRRESLLAALAALGFNSLSLNHEDKSGPHSPSLSIVARRE